VIRISMENTQASVPSYDASTDGQSLAEVLEKTLLLLSVYENWCQGAFALSAERKKVKINSPDAVAWSIEGAVGKSSNDLGIVPLFILKYLDLVVVRCTGKNEDVGWYNDNYTHEGVIGFLQEALRRCCE